MPRLLPWALRIAEARHVACAALICVLSLGVRAQAPAGYYAGVNLATPALLRATLHQAIDDHLRIPYTSSSTDTWDVLESADQDPANPGNILDVNKNASFPKQGGGNTYYDRDHIWPKSYGFPDDNSSNYPYTDCHMLFLSDQGYNNLRGNKPYRDCAQSCSEEPTLVNNAQGGGAGIYPGNSNWTVGQGTPGTWEQWAGKRGDVARALFYMDVRYEGGTHGVTGAPEPDLILSDDLALIAGSITGKNEPIAYYGMLSTLLLWHREDPVDALERRRNDVVYGFQGNRNPFVDHPEWVECLFGVQATAAEVVRPGNPPNPAALLGGLSGPPRLGWLWLPRIDHSTFLTGAAADVLAITAVPANLPTPFGTLLCDLTAPSFLFPASPGVAFSIAFPSDCRFAGIALCTQGISVDGAGSIALTNALDITLGY